MKPKFDGYAAQYDAWFMENDNLFQSELRLFQRALGIFSGQRVLSVGCGSDCLKGMIITAASRASSASRDMGAIAQKRGVNVIAFGAIGCRPGGKCLRCDLPQRQLSSYMDDLHKAFALSAKRLLKPGGRFISLDVPKERMLSALCICWLRIWAPLTILI